MNNQHILLDYDNYVKDYKFSFEGPLGSYDQNQLQRGLKVYTEICGDSRSTQFHHFINV